MSFVGPRATLPPGPIRSSLLGAEPDRAGEVRFLGWLDRLGLRDDLASLPQGLDTELTPEVQQQLGDALQMALVVLPTLLDSRSILLVDMWLVHRAGRGTAQALLELLEERIVLVCATGLSLPGYLSRRVIVAQQGRVAGIGSLEWFETVKGELKQIGTAAAPSLADEAAEIAG